MMKTFISLLYLTLLLSALSGCDVVWPMRAAPAGIATHAATISQNDPRLSVVSEPAAVSHRAMKSDILSAIDLNAETSEQKKLLEMHRLTGVHTGDINSLIVTVDGMTAFSAGVDGKVIQTTIASSEHSRNRDKDGMLVSSSRTLLQGSEPILAISLSPDETKLAVAQISHLSIFDLTDQKITNVLTQVEGRITALAWDPRGEFLVFGGADGGLYVWNLTSGRAAGLDNRDALEFYPGGISPMVSLIFHPQGRIFFATEHDGYVTLWRLLRTEREIGLRDDAADIDRDRKGNERKVIANLGIILHEAWLDSRTQFYYVAGDDGKLYRWKVRGAKRVPPLEVSKAALFAVSGTNVVVASAGKAGSPAESNNVSVIFVTGRAQGLSIWAVPEPFAVVADEAPQLQDECLLGRTALFPDELNQLRMGNDGKTLWAGEKTGSLLTFDVEEYLSRQEIQAKLKSCINNLRANGPSQR